MIPIRDDNILEVDDETFMVSVDDYSSSLPITIGDPGNATLTIVDNDSKELIKHLSVALYINWWYGPVLITRVPYKWMGYNLFISHN